MGDYIKWIRSRVGHDTIILNFSVACIINENGEILLQKRSDKDDIWGLPGGAVEIGESIEDTVIREVKEEIGLNVEVEHFIGVYSKYFHTYPNGNRSQSICHLFKCRMINGELMVDNKETFDLKFFDKNNIPKLFIEQHTDMLNDFFQNKIGVFK